MRISDWSSDVCSSDLGVAALRGEQAVAGVVARRRAEATAPDLFVGLRHPAFGVRDRRGAQQGAGGITGDRLAVRIERGRQGERGLALGHGEHVGLGDAEIVLVARSEEHKYATQSLKSN